MPARVYVVASIKGGAGKSTLVACLAVHWLMANKRVALLDTDPNKTLTRWHSKGGALSEATLETELDEHAIQQRVAKLRAKHDFVLVDCAGFANQAMVFAIGCADLVLIPAMADEASVYEAVRTRRVVESASAMARRSISPRTVLVRTKHRSGVARHARAQLEALGADPLGNELADRSVFQEASFFGSSPSQIAPSSLAAAEVGRLAAEIVRLR